MRRAGGGPPSDGRGASASRLLLDAARDASRHGALASAQALHVRARDLLAGAPSGESQITYTLAPAGLTATDEAPLYAG